MAPSLFIAILAWKLERLTTVLQCGWEYTGVTNSTNSCKLGRFLTLVSMVARVPACLKCAALIHFCKGWISVCTYITVALLLSNLLLKLHSGEYDEARQLILGALRMRRKYMELSQQHFYSTTTLLLDGELPPSSDFCIPQNVEGVSFTTAGDVISSELLCFNTGVMRVHIKLYCPEIINVKVM